jgi:hypothetical protein
MLRWKTRYLPLLVSIALIAIPVLGGIAELLRNYDW